MNIFVYSDESGVFDKEHNEYFVFGGLIFLDKESRDICARKYSKAESDVKSSTEMAQCQEAKASALSNKYKAKLGNILPANFSCYKNCKLNVLQFLPKGPRSCR